MEDLENLEDLGNLESGDSPLCFDCAVRLGKYTWPEVPELLFGYCPQCGGTKPLTPIANVSDLTAPRVQATPERQQQVA